MMSLSKYSLKERLNLEELYQRFLALGPREQMFSLGGIALLVLLLLVLPLACASSKLGDLQKERQNHQENVAKIQGKIQIYESDQARLKQLKKNIKSESEVALTTLLENLANKSGIADKIKSLDDKKYEEAGDGFRKKILTASMSRIPLSQLIEFLYTLEDQKNIKLTLEGIQLKPRYDNRELFDVTFSASTLVKREER